MNAFTLEDFFKSDTAYKHQINNVPSNPIIYKNCALSVHFLNLLSYDYNLFCGDIIKLNSGYRNEQVNELVGGSVTSAHLKGLAMDVSCNDCLALYEFIKRFYLFDQLIIYYDKEKPINRNY